MVITEHFTVWLYFHDEQTRQQIKVKMKKHEKNISETVAVVDIGTPRSSLHQIAFFSYLSVHRRSRKICNAFLNLSSNYIYGGLLWAPQICLKRLLPYLRSKSTLYGSYPVAYSIHKIASSGATVSGFGHPHHFVRHRFSNMKQSNSRSNPYLSPCMKCDVAKIRN
jgi:hypothetical protein